VRVSRRRWFPNRIASPGGFSVLRFANQNVRDDIDSVLRRIGAELRLPFG